MARKYRVFVVFGQDLSGACLGLSRESERLKQGSLAFGGVKLQGLREKPPLSVSCWRARQRSRKNRSHFEADESMTSFLMGMAKK